MSKRTEKTSADKMQQIQEYQNYQRQQQRQRKEELNNDYKELTDSFVKQKEYYREKKDHLERELEERNQKQKSATYLLVGLGIAGLVGTIVVTKKRPAWNKTSHFDPAKDSKGIHSSALNVAIASLFFLSLLLIVLPWVYRHIQDINMKNGTEEQMRKISIVLLFAGLLSLTLTGVVCGFGAFNNSDASTMGVVSAIIFSLAIIYLCASYFSSSKDKETHGKSMSLKEKIKNTDEKIEALEKEEEDARENFNKLLSSEITIRMKKLQDHYNDYNQSFNPYSGAAPRVENMEEDITTDENEDEDEDDYDEDDYGVTDAQERDKSYR